MLYQKLAQVTQLEELTEIREELKDRYGIFYQEVRNLLEIVYLKIFLQKLSINFLVVKEGKIIIRYQKIVEVETKLRKLPFSLRQRIIEVDIRRQGISQINISEIKPSEILKFLKKFVLELAK